MIKIVRTDSDNRDFIKLVKALDAVLAEIDGDDHLYYAQFNKVDKIKQVVVAYQDDLPVGCGAIKRYSPNTMEVKRMYTAPGNRGAGVATSVLAELETWATELRCEKCVLETGKRQPDAIGLYKKNGYRMIPNYGQYAGVENSVCFEKELNFMPDQVKPLRILVVGCGNMGASHATAYHTMNGFDICGIVSTGASKQVLNDKLGGGYTLYNDYEEALAATRPDAVCISTYPDTHERFAITALESGCHVFIEKPLADSVSGAVRVVAAAHKAGKKLVVGYILRHHPSWMRFVELAQQLGKPLVMRMNLNQQSHGHKWMVHRNLMQSLSPIVDCGVHYIDVMCQMTRSKPVKVSAIGARLSPDIPADNYNYGQLQIRFEDGSVGWYEAGWGPMISETAFFVKDVMGPQGAVSIVAKKSGSAGESDNISAHTKTESLRFHHAALNDKGEFVKEDTWINMDDEPDHQELCNREQAFFLDAIRKNVDLSNHMEDAVSSLRIAFACDESVRTGKVVLL